MSNAHWSIYNICDVHLNKSKKKISNKETNVCGCCLVWTEVVTYQNGNIHTSAYSNLCWFGPWILETNFALRCYCLTGRALSLHIKYIHTYPHIRSSMWPNTIQLTQSEPKFLGIVHHLLRKLLRLFCATQNPAE